MDSFEQVRTLEPAALRELLATGRPEQRVWASWAIALRTGGLVGVADASTRDRDAGVRRTLAVMLASHEEYDMLVALARRDPEPLVRDSAMRLVARIAAQGALPSELVVEGWRADRAVRAAIMAAIDRGAPAFLVELAAEQLRAGSPDEQADAFEALVRTEARELCRAAVAWLTALRDPCVAIVRMI